MCGCGSLRVAMVLHVRVCVRACVCKPVQLTVCVCVRAAVCVCVCVCITGLDAREVARIRKAAYQRNLKDLKEQAKQEAKLQKQVGRQQEHMGHTHTHVGKQGRTQMRERVTMVAR